MNNVREILSFWFQDTRPRQWFARDSAFDALLRDRFFTPTRAAIAGDLVGWGAEPLSGLALALLLDQFPRQIWQGSAMAIAGDAQALALSLLNAVTAGLAAAVEERMAPNGDDHDSDQGACRCGAISLVRRSAQSLNNQKDPLQRKESVGMEPSGLEPLTPCMPCRNKFSLKHWCN